MPVVSTVERIERLLRETLDRLASDDDIVEYAIHVTVEETDPEDPPQTDSHEEPERCEDCGAIHVSETVVAIFISLDCPETNSHSQSHWYCPIRQTYDDAQLIEAIEETWTRICSRRQFYALDCGLVASTDEVPSTAEGKD